jgi:hypothetical protein
VKETHRKTSDLQSFATATEDENVACVGNEIDDAIDIATIDTLNCTPEVPDGAREQIRVRDLNDISVRATPLIARKTGLDKNDDEQEHSTDYTLPVRGERNRAAAVLEIEDIEENAEQKHACKRRHY